MGLYLISRSWREGAETGGDAGSLSLILLGSCLAWSPDSRWLAVCDWAEDSPGRLSVFLLSVDSGERRRLTTPLEGSTLGDVLPAFSPDGRTLAFCRVGSASSDLYLLDLDEDLNPQGEPRRRTFMEQLIFGQFTSDGRDIVFSAGSMTNSSVLWRVPVSGTASPERLPFGENGGRAHCLPSGESARVYSAWSLNMNIYRLKLPVADGVTGTAVKFISSFRWDTRAKIFSRRQPYRVRFASLRGLGNLDV